MRPWERPKAVRGHVRRGREQPAEATGAITSVGRSHSSTAAGSCARPSSSTASRFGAAAEESTSWGRDGIWMREVGIRGVGVVFLSRRDRRRERRLRTAPSSRRCRRGRSHPPCHDRRTLPGPRSSGPSETTSAAGWSPSAEGCVRLGLAVGSSGGRIVSQISAIGSADAASRPPGSGVGFRGPLEVSGFGSTGSLG